MFILTESCCIVVKQRGTNELKKYLRGRIEPDDSARSTAAPVFEPVDGTSGIIGGTGDGVDRYRIASTKTLEFWSVVNCAMCF